jgi:hypothetical protein
MTCNTSSGSSKGFAFSHIGEVADYHNSLGHGFQGIRTVNAVPSVPALIQINAT